MHNNTVPAASGLAGKAFRTDIQAMRAIAVLLVLVFHVWPTVLPGGYVGVDVFFVISGYLITGILLRQVATEGRIDFLRFYARRIRRLVPAATVVLLAVFAGSLMLLPELHWYSTAREIIAAAIYMENWWLAATAGDYFAIDHAPSLLQHYWSLAIEEQFYFVWPGFIALVCWGASRREKGSRWILIACISLLFAVSLAHSIVATGSRPEWSYFATTTRAWELALGGIIAAAAPVIRGPALRSASAGAGLVAILGAAALFDGDTAFPGWLALIPTAGTALLIIAGNGLHATSLVGRMLGTRPIQYLGDISYSLYLWHWPVIGFYLHITGGYPGLAGGLALLALSVGLADLTKRLVEDPIYRGSRTTSGVRGSFLLGATCAGVAIAAGAALLTLPAGIDGRQKDTGHPGAAVMTPGFPHDFRPGLAAARQDIEEWFRECHGSVREVEPVLCGPPGSPDSEVEIALVGDSHAGQWAPALSELATRHQARIHIFTKSSCPFTSAQVLKDDGRRAYDECNEWNRSLVDQLLEMKPALVVSSASSTTKARMRGEDGAAAIAIGQKPLWELLDEAGIRVAVIRDTPRPGRAGIDPPECLSDPANRPADCAVARRRAVFEEHEDVNLLGASELAWVHQVDLTDYICSAAACDPIVGNVLVWRDNNHLTATYARTLGPVLADMLEPALAAAPTQGIAPVASAPGEAVPEEDGIQYTGLLSCGPTGRHPPFEREVTYFASKTWLRVRVGNWSSGEGRFEIWDGQLGSDADLHVTGRYREGGGSVRKIALRGRLADGAVDLAGQRGPRQCTFTSLDGHD